MPYVSVVLSDGLGNRLFQIAAMLRYSAVHGHTPVFLEDHLCENPHGGVDVRLLFPAIPTIRLSDSEAWEELREDGCDVFRYKEMPVCAGNTLLRGYFQNWQNVAGSAGFGPIHAFLAWAAPLRKNTAFLHIRRGDYLHPDCMHHCIELHEYYERCLPLYYGAQILVCSDDIAWCRKEVPRAYGHIIPADAWIWCERGPLETLAEMAACERGGICANSTFSWWGAWFGRGLDASRIYCMPTVWGEFPLPPAVDIWPPWVMQVAVKK